LNGTNDFRKAEKNDDRPDRPRTDLTNDNIKKVQDRSRKDRRLSVRAVAEKVSLDRENVRQILRKELNMKMVCAKMVPKLLSPGQRASPQCIIFEANFS
jgi:propanediol utilization protein